MITNGEYEIDRVLCIPPNEGKGAPCGACRELMTQLMPGKYKDIDITINGDLPNYKPIDKSILYFNRLKRYYGPILITVSAPFSSSDCI